MLGKWSIFSQRTHHIPPWSGLLRLSRWKEHLLFTVPATVLGANMAAAHSPAVALDGRIAIVTLANILAVTCAFMINDVEDAPDDARQAERAARNAVASGEITRQQGWLAAGATALVALVLFAWTSRGALAAGTLTILLTLLYSWRSVRLKALPVVDVLAHVLMLSALLFLAGFLAYRPDWGRVWPVVLGVALISAYGQLYNQVRDYDMDRAAGLRNTASFAGPRGTRWLMIGCLFGAVCCLGVSVAMGLWPLWLVPVAALMAPLVWWAQSGVDMRGTAAVDVSGRLQWGVMWAANGLVLVWLAVLLI